jgi:acetyl-CoA synthetase
MSDWIWQPTPEFATRTNVFRYMQRLGFNSYERDREAFLRISVEHLEEFWGDLAVELGVEWSQPFTKVLDTSRGVEWARWYSGGKLNIAANTLDRHARGPASGRMAIVSECEDGSRRELTFAELGREVTQVANALADLNLEPGDRVALVMPLFPST